MNPQQNFMGILQVASLLVGMQNLQENRIQTQHNDVQSANDRQAAYMLAEISKSFKELNTKLDKVMQALKI